MNEASIGAGTYRTPANQLENELNDAFWAPTIRLQKDPELTQGIMARAKVLLRLLSDPRGDGLEPTSLPWYGEVAALGDLGDSTPDSLDELGTEVRSRMAELGFKTTPELTVIDGLWSGLTTNQGLILDNPWDFTRRVLLTSRAGFNTFIGPYGPREADLLNQPGYESRVARAVKRGGLIVGTDRYDRIMSIRTDRERIAVINRRVGDLVVGWKSYPDVVRAAVIVTLLKESGGSQFSVSKTGAFGPGQHTMWWYGASGEVKYSPFSYIGTVWALIRSACSDLVDGGKTVEEWVFRYATGKAKVVGSTSDPTYASIWKRIGAIQTLAKDAPFLNAPASDGLWVWRPLVQLIAPETPAKVAKVDEKAELVAQVANSSGPAKPKLSLKKEDLPAQDPALPPPSKLAQTQFEVRAARSGGTREKETEALEKNYEKALRRMKPQPEINTASARSGKAGAGAPND